VSAKIPAEIRNSCVIYTAWRVEIARRLVQAGGCSAGLEGRITILLEGLAEFAEETKDGGRLALPARKVMELPPIPIQSELFDLNTVLLYTMRNGHDADWLGNNLPQLYTVSHFVSKVKMLHGAKSSSNQAVSTQGDEHLFALYWYDLCAVARNQSYWAQYSRGGGGAGCARKNVALVGIVQYLCAQRSDSYPGKTAPCIMMKLRDAQGCVVSVMVHEDETGLRERLLKAVESSPMQRVNSSTEERCPRCAGRSITNQPAATLAMTESKAKPVNSNNVREEYCLPCSCGVHGGSASYKARDDELVVVLHRPYALVERIPQSAGISSELRFIAMCSTRDVSIVTSDQGAKRDDASQAVGARVAGHVSSSSGVPLPVQGTGSAGSADVSRVGIRQLLSADLLNARQKHVPGVVAIVTHIQVLVVEFKQDATRDGDNAPGKGAPSSSAGSRKRPLESQYSLYENAGDQSNSGNIAAPIALSAERKCSVVLRDLSYPDHINIYLPLTSLQGVMVGSIVEIRDLLICVPESQKKLYLKPVDPARCTVGKLCPLQSQCVACSE
jgi:hypothetical protein